MKCLNKDRRAIEAAAEFPKKLETIHEGRISLRPDAVYLGSMKKIAVVCNVCSYEWEPTVHSLLAQKKSCSRCRYKNNSKKMKGRTRPKASKEMKALAVACYEAGMCITHIARLLGWSFSAVSSWCRPEVAEKHRVSARRIRDADPERHKARLSEWRGTKRGQLVSRNYGAKRRALKYHAVFEVEVDGRLIEVDNWELIKGDSDAMEMMSFEGAEAAWTQKHKQCKRLEKISGIKWSVDHLVPLSRGGIHHPANFKLVPLADNLAKRNKFVPEDYALFARRLFNIQ